MQKKRKMKCEGAEGKERGAGGGECAESGGKEIRALSLSELSCEWCFTVSIWLIKIAGPTAVICSAHNTHIHKSMNTPYQ